MGRKARQAAAPAGGSRVAPEVVNEDRLRRPDALWCAGIALAALIVYLLTLCPTLHTSGAGENVTAAATLGVPHPPGFPLFCLLGKLFTLLVPAGSAALRVNLFSATAGAAAAGCIFLALRLLLGPAARAASAAAALLFAWSHTFWSQAVIAEVYTLNALTLVAVLLALLLWERGGRLWPAGLLVGLGLAVHPLQVFFFPAWLILVFRSERRSAPGARALLQAAGAFAAGLSLHLYPLVRSQADPFLDWGNPERVKNWLAYLTAAQYRGRMFTLPPATVLANVERAGRQLLDELTPWLAPLPLIGAWLCFRRERRLFLATLLPAAITFVYAVNYDIPWEIEVYFIPVVLVLGLWSAFALAPAGERLGRARAALPLLALAPLAVHWRENDRSEHRVVLALGHDLLAGAPRGATLVVPDTDPTFALLYLQAVEGERPDVTVWVLTSGKLKPLRRAVDPDLEPLTLPQLMKQVNGPVCTYDRVPSDALAVWQSQPLGALYRLHRKGEPAPAIEPRRYELEAYVDPLPAFALDEATRIVLAGYSIGMGDLDFALGRPEAGRARYGVAAEVGGEVAAVQRELGRRYADLGENAAAVEWLEKSIAARDDALARNRLGRIFIGEQRLEEALAAFARAVELDPENAIFHSNRGGCLAMLARTEEALAEFETAVRLDPASLMARNNLARALQLTGERERAIAEWRASLALDPAQEEARRSLAELGVRP